MDAAIAILEGLNETPIVERGALSVQQAHELHEATELVQWHKYAVTAVLAFVAGYWASNRMAKRSSALSDYF